MKSTNSRARENIAQLTLRNAHPGEVFGDIGIDGRLIRPSAQMLLTINTTIGTLIIPFRILNKPEEQETSGCGMLLLDGKQTLTRGGNAHSAYSIGGGIRLAVLNEELSLGRLAETFIHFIESVLFRTPSLSDSKKASLIEAIVRDLQGIFSGEELKNALRGLEREFSEFLKLFGFDGIAFSGEKTGVIVVFDPTEAKLIEEKVELDIAA